MCAALGRGEVQPAVVAFASIVVGHARNSAAVRALDAAQIRIVQCAVARRAAPEIDDVGPPRNQLHRKPIPVAPSADIARRRVADRNPANRRCIRGKVLAVRLGHRLRSALLALRDQRLDLLRLLHVGDVDGDGDVAVQAAVTRPHRQFVAGRPRLVVLARALVRQGARLGVDGEQATGVARLDAVAHRRIFGVRGRYRAQRYTDRPAVRVLRQVERIAPLGERRRLIRPLCCCSKAATTSGLAALTP